MNVTGLHGRIELSFWRAALVDIEANLGARSARIPSSTAQDGGPGLQRVRGGTRPARWYTAAPQRVILTRLSVLRGLS